MATSSPLSTSNQYVKYTITITQNSQSVTDNTSNVTVSVRFYRTNTGYTTYGSGTVYLKINGTTYTESVTPDEKITNSGIVLIRRTLNIAHNTNGSKTLNTSAWINLNTPLTASEQSYAEALTTIPRATTPTVNVSSVVLGGSVTISTPRASSSFTHTLRYGFANTSGTIESGVATQKTWTVPLSLANQIPNATSGKLSIFCDTYNGSTKIGTKAVSITVTVPSTAVPTISSVSITEAESGIASKFNAFIKSKSRLNVSISATGSYSSSIISYDSTACGNKYQGANFTVNTVNLCNTVNLVTTVKDSRGKTASVTNTVTVLDYSLPTIDKFRAWRCNQDGSSNDEGAYLYIDYGFTITALNNQNDKSYTIKYKKDGDDEYTTLTSGSVYSLDTHIVPATTFDVDSAYTLLLTVSDYFKTISREIPIATAFTLVDFHSGGKGIAFGKVAETANLFDEGLPAIFRSSALLAGGLTHNIPTINSDLDTIDVSGFYYVGTPSSNRPVEVNGYLEVFVYEDEEGYIYQRYITYQGTTYERVQVLGVWSRWCGKFTNGVWTYEIKLNGNMELFAKIPITNLSMTTALATWFRSAVISGSSYAYPVEFTTEPVVNMQYRTSNGYGGLVWITNEGTVSAPPDFYIIRPTSASGAYGYIDAHINGKWK